MNWIKITPSTMPEENIVFTTKIDDGKGERNIQKLKRIKNLWWFADGSMHVYYTPTHYAI